MKAHRSKLCLSLRSLSSDELFSFLPKLMRVNVPSEGNYLSMVENLDFYEPDIKRVSVFKLSINELSFKVKLGQNWKVEKRKEIAGLLQERNTPIDLKTYPSMVEHGVFSE